MDSVKESKQAASTFDAACVLIGDALRGNTRREILDVAFEQGDTIDSLVHIRNAMGAHRFPTASGALNLRSIVDKLDARSRREGLHVLEGWDYRSHKFPDDIIPILLLDYCARLGIPEEKRRSALAILLDQYFLYLLALLAVRAWDDGDANANLDRVTALIADLHNEQGSGLRVIEDADTILLLAIAYYNPEEESFGRLMKKVRTLDASHQRRLALPFAGILGSHLRWGFRFMYSRDVAKMRNDNVVDYPMLLFAIVTLLRAYAPMVDAGAVGAERELVVEGLLNALASDPWAFSGPVPASLVGDRAEYDECVALLSRYRTHLLEDFGIHQPSGKGFSPLGFSCSFLSNASVVIVAIATQAEDARKQASLNSLFTRGIGDPSNEEAAADLAERLMKFSSERPERLGWEGAPLIVHDQRDAVHWYNVVRRTI